MSDDVITTEGRSNVPLRSIVTQREPYTWQSTYSDMGAGNAITSGTEFFALELVMTGTTLTIYKYTNSHAPGETVDRVLVDTLTDIDICKFMFVAINIADIYGHMTAGKTLCAYAKYYDSGKDEWHNIGTTQGFLKGTDTLESSPVIKTDKGSWVWLAEGVAIADGDRLTVCFNTDENIAAAIEMPTKVFIEGVNTLDV